MKNAVYTADLLFLEGAVARHARRGCDGSGGAALAVGGGRARRLQ